MATDTRHVIGARIEAELQRRGLTQAWLAQELGMPLTTVHRKLKGEKYEFTPTEIEEIATLLEVAPATFMPASFVICACTHD